MTGLVIAVDHPRRDDVQALLRRHLTFAHEHTPIEHAFALDVDALLEPDVTFFAARRDGALLAVGALKELDARHAEVKSMHTAGAARRQGVGRAMVQHLLGVARDRGYDRVSLETGTMDAFAPARALYRDIGFVPCGPFAGYRASPDNTFMTLELSASRAGTPAQP